MKIQELENKTVQIGKTSITVKDKFLKTCGVVKNIQTVQTLSRGEHSTSEEKHYNKILNSIESAEKNGIMVIRCGWIFDIL